MTAITTLSLVGCGGCGRGESGSSSAVLEYNTTPQTIEQQTDVDMVVHSSTKDKDSSMVASCVDAINNLDYSNTTRKKVVDTMNSDEVRTGAEGEVEIIELVTDTLISHSLENWIDSVVCVKDSLSDLNVKMQPSLLNDTIVAVFDEHIEEVVKPKFTQRGLIHRDATKALFIPKGQWMFGGQVGWNKWDNENMNYLVLEDVTFKGQTFSVGPYLGYFFAKNMAIGGRFSYKRNYFNVEEVGLDLGEGLSFDLQDFYYLQHSYRSCVFLRSYIPIAESKIFGLFGELQLNYAFSEGKSSQGRGDMLTGVYENKQSLGLGLGGGLVVFLTDFAAAEVMLNVGGYDFDWGYQTIKKIDEIDKGCFNRSGANFKIDILSIQFGLTFYL